MVLGRLPGYASHLSGAAQEMDLVRSLEHVSPQSGAAQEMGRGHWLEHATRQLEAVPEMDLVRLPKKRGLSFEARKLPQRALR
jgi:hypothetical protein